jgi:hypothetical protein
MFEKGGKFYADWRNRKGKRLRKSFTSKRAAQQFEDDMKEAAHPKTKALVRRWPKYSAPNTSAFRTAISSKSSPGKSSESRAALGNL